jgi:hypothetical protein
MVRPGRSGEYHEQREATRHRVARLRSRQRQTSTALEPPGTFLNIFLNHDPRVIPAPHLDSQSAFSHFHALRDALEATPSVYDEEHPCVPDAIETWPLDEPKVPEQPHASQESQ